MLYCVITNTAESQWRENKNADMFKTEIIELVSISLLSRECTTDAFTLSQDLFNVNYSLESFNL